MTVTIQHTGKVWKAGMAISTIAAGVGLAVFVAAPTEQQGAEIFTTGMFGLGTCLMGFIGLLACRIGAWWFHG